ncbi:MAG: hypothetical protein Q4G28_12685 [Neisseria sp.]|nr:hypothetical protein [Neisseria sp.]
MNIRDDMFAYLSHWLGTPIRLFTGEASTLPPLWRDYASDDMMVRRAALQRELADVEAYFPETMRRLAQIALDALVVETGRSEVLRVIVYELGGQQYYAYSASPLKQQTAADIWKLFQAHAPQVMSWLYRERMNGLTDVYGFAGFKSLAEMTSMAEEINTYGEADWYEEFAARHDTRLMVEILSTGGGAYLLLDLSCGQSQAEDPDGWMVYMKENRPPEKVGFFPYLDALMAIGLTDA